MTIYVDSEYKCHASGSTGLRPFDVQFFDNRATYFIESYRYVPSNEIWVDEKGVIFRGEMIAPWRDYQIAEVSQNAYEEGIVTGESESAEIIGIIEGSVEINDES